MSETQTGGRAEGGAPGPAGDRELLQQAEAVLTKYWKAALVLKPMLDVPYPERPELTHWTLWMEPVARQAHDLSMALRKRLKAGGADPDRLADVEGEMGGAVELAQTWAVMPGTITYADAARFMLDALGYGPGGQT